VAGVGGYMAPANPAPVSGPGALSQRTDGGPGQPVRDLPNAKYGEAKAFTEQEAGAPMAGAGPAMPPVVGLDAPSTRPDEHVTHGAPLGPGGGPEVLGPAAPPATGQLSSLLAGLAAGDMTGALAGLYDAALQRGL
jgi:hypothetical protein